MRPSGILETALYVADLDAAEAFYGEVMGLERIAKVPGRHVFFRCGRACCLLFNAEATGSRRRRTRNCRCRRTARWARAISAFGAPPMKLRDGRPIWRPAASPSKPISNGRMAGRSIYFRDPSGNSLEIAEPRIWGI